MKQIRSLAVALCASASLALPASAQDSALLRGDVVAFEACFIQLMLDNPDNPMLDAMGPIVCGERNIPMRQTCDVLDYMLFDRRAVCKSDDLAFWQAQVEIRSAGAIADGRSGVGALHSQGQERCTELDGDSDDALDCEIELNWRTSMEFIAAALVAGLAEANE